MPVKQLPSVEYLNKALRYEPDTGLLFWRERPLEHFVSENRMRAINTRCAGKIAFTAICNGYRVGSVGSTTARAHRIIWKMMTGGEPDLIDHIDRDKLNNRFSNLREASASLNAKNQDLRRGVTITPHRKVFQLWIKRDGVRYYGGQFRDLCSAENARIPFLERLGFANDERLARATASWYSDTAD